MRTFATLLVLGVACGGGGGGETAVDSPPAIDAPPATDAPPAPASCRHFGAFSIDEVTGTAAMGLNASGVLSDPSVVHLADGYHLWFTSVAFSGSASSLQTAYAVSSDGLAFSGLVDPVLAATPGGWDAGGVETVSVLRGSDGDYRMWYAGDLAPANSTQYAIGFASSPDGVTWTKQPAAPVLPPVTAWEQEVCIDPPACTQQVGGTLEPSVIADGSGFQMWYAALGELAGAFTFRIGHAASPDGLAWTHDPDPALEPAGSGSFDDALVSQVDVVADPAGGFHMFYFGSSAADAARCASGCAMTPGSIGHAFSSDGVVWTRDAAPLIVPRAGEFDAWAVGGPSVLIEDGHVVIYYFGNADQGSFTAALGRAQADCLP